jgi:hypothetical protein
MYIKADRYIPKLSIIKTDAIQNSFPQFVVFEEKMYETPWIVTLSAKFLKLTVPMH